MLLAIYSEGRENCYNRRLGRASDYRVENIVRLETRNANTEGKGEITIRDLIRTSLRMRPERILW